MTSYKKGNPAAYILAAFCFTTIMMLFAIYDRVVYFIGNDFCFNLVMIIIMIFYIAAMVGFVIDGIGTVDKAGAP